MCEYFKLRKIRFVNGNNFLYVRVTHRGPSDFPSTSFWIALNLQKKKIKIKTMFVRHRDRQRKERNCKLQLPPYPTDCRIEFQRLLSHIDHLYHFQKCYYMCISYGKMQKKNYSRIKGPKIKLFVGFFYNFLDVP